MSEGDLAEAIEVIEDRLYWVPLHITPQNTKRTYFFCIDHELIYEPFFADFGPLNLARVYRYCKKLEGLLADTALSEKRIVHYCGRDPKKCTNAATLMGIFQLAVLGRSADEAYEPFASVYPPFRPYRDATCGACSFDLTILDCLRGMEEAIRHRWFDVNRFQVESYEFFEKVENGDLTWIVPNKFLAFAGPCPHPTDDDGYPVCTPEEYLPIFKRAGISLIVRLNKKQYDRRRFIDHGIRHVDLYFLDGSCPSREIISRFLHITENEPGTVAVHCKAGLGRTGTLIGLYVMKHYQFTARAFIAWNRICRPGSILGPQQQFLVDMQDDMWQAGAAQRRGPLGIDAERSLILQTQSMSLRQAEEHEDAGQGQRLRDARRRGSPAPPAAATADHPLPLVGQDGLPSLSTHPNQAIGGDPDQNRPSVASVGRGQRSDRPGVRMLPRSLRGVFSGRQ